MMKQTSVNAIFREWGRLGFSQLLNIDQRGGDFSFEFVVDQSPAGTKLLQKIVQLTVKKHPTGNVSFVSYYSSPNIPISTLYRKYRADFQDPANKDEIDEEKLEIYANNLIMALDIGS